MAETVSIPREEYELLLKCKKIVDSDFEEKFSEEFIRAIRKSRKDYREGRVRRAKSRRGVQAILRSL